MKFVYSTGARPLDGYTIKRGIGIGGFGEVYFATSDGGKEVALKRIQRNLDIELRGVRHCLNLKHVNLIDLYDIRYDDEGGAWVVMEYVGGQSLKEVLDRNPNGLPEDEARWWFAGIARGVGCLHDHGIVHRDLKPGNVFSDHQVVKIGDYGLSKFISCSRRSGHTESVGTFHYMAPEIGKGVYGKEIDVYALGIILFEMLTGRVPFNGESSQEIIMKHLTADPDLDELREPFRSAVRRAMHKDPDRRFASVQEMLDQLDTAPAAADPAAADPAAADPAAADPAAEIPAAAVVDEPRDEGPAEHYIGEADGAAGAQTSPAAAAGAEAKPPVRGEDATADGRQTFYITEEGAGDDMVFGPVRQALWGAPPRPAARRQAATSAAAGGFPRRERPWAPYATALKIVLLIGACLLAAVSPGFLTLALAAVCVATLLFGGRALATAGLHTSTSLREQAELRRRTRRCLHAAHSRKPFSETMSELIGSLLFAAVACAVISLLAVSLADMPLQGDVQTWSVFLWLTLTTTLGAWLVLAAGKCWESHEGDSMLRRFVMLCSALGLGIAAFGGAHFLNVQFHSQMPVVDVSPLLQSDAWYGGQQPRLPAYLAYFAGIFGVVRWWTQVDPLRPARLSLAATGLCVLWAWVLHTVFYFPQPWGMMLAGTISVASQLAGPWLSASDRGQIQQEYQEAIG